jgi:hypothetical protein
MKNVNQDVLREISLDEARDALSIDKHALDEELVRVPELLYHVSSRAVRAVALVDKAKRKLEELRAELYTKTRTQLEKANEGRVTELMISNTLELAPSYVVARDTLAKWQVV